MKVLIGGFVAESNARVKKPCRLQDFMMKTGDEVVDALYVRDLFEEAGVEVIPTVYADGRAGGRMEKEAFDFILEQFLKGVREHMDEIDGMFFFLHGASNVLGLEGGSGSIRLYGKSAGWWGRIFPLPWSWIPMEICPRSRQTTARSSAPSGILHTRIVRTVTGWWQSCFLTF